MNDRFKFRVWDNKLSQYRTAGDIQLGANGQTFVISKELPNLYQYIDDVVVEFCTGLKDKNGNLIYEGDIIRFCVNWRAYVLTYERIVVWDKDKCGFAVRNAKDQAAPLTKWKMPHPDTHIIEIVGNIHKQKD